RVEYDVNFLGVWALCPVYKKHPLMVVQPRYLFADRIPKLRLNASKTVQAKPFAFGGHVSHCLKSCSRFLWMVSRMCGDRTRAALVGRGPCDFQLRFCNNLDTHTARRIHSSRRLCRGCCAAFR